MLILLILQEKFIIPTNDGSRKIFDDIATKFLQKLIWSENGRKFPTNFRKN